ncbi:type II secretion system minor pseudopilin GspK [Veronia pacifica]|uniref:Type II secretion system protein K n=1 Tax=Veronia pacifica TaxID=1080227 RepID=A0A1C3EJQ9_9GAMM|nr:type II secretion system minor pseudopilin GspK [Veronia pacifica]ODA33464.1 general secretion pathway protein GspK [Veronia pacifica]
MSRRQRGVALLVVMFIMALMTSLAMNMTGRLFVNFNRVESQIRYEQAYWYTMAVEQLTGAVLKASIPDSGAVTLAQAWSVKDQTYPVDGATVTGSIIDRQACFNLNAFQAEKPTQNGTNPPLVTALQQLLISQDIDSTEAENIASATWEFIDRDTNVQSALGVEDSEYESRNPAYVTPNGLLADATEWRAVNGVTQQIERKVGRFLCAIPSDTATLNVNTLTEDDAPVLAALLHPNLSVDQARTLIKNRDSVAGWSDEDAFLSDPIFGQLGQPEKDNLKKYIGVRSRFFEVDSTIKLDEARFRTRALLMQDENDSKYTVVRRRFGGVSERNTDDKTKQ